MKRRFACTFQVRVFNRSCFFGKEILPCFGIGEVSTDPAYRGKGLARHVMNDSLDRIDCGPATVSSLSAAEGVERFYASFGYVAFPMRYTALKVPLTPSPAAPAASLPTHAAEGESAVARRIRSLASSFGAAAATVASAVGVGSAAAPAPPAASPEYQVTLQGTELRLRPVPVAEYVFELSTVYDHYNSGLWGTVARSHAYWREYVPFKLPHGLWGAFAANPAAAPAGGAGTGAPFTSLVGYVGVVEKRGKAKLAEYGAAKGWEGDAGLFSTLLQVACLNNPAVSALGCVSEGSSVPSVPVITPMAPLTRLPELGAVADEKLTDDSWMYRIRPGLEVEPKQTAARGKRKPRGLQPWQVLAGLQGAAAKDLHVMWFTDAF